MELDNVEMDLDNVEMELCRRVALDGVLIQDQSRVILDLDFEKVEKVKRGTKRQ